MDGCLWEWHHVRQQYSQAGNWKWQLTALSFHNNHCGKTLLPLKLKQMVQNSSSRLIRDSDAIIPHKFLKFCRVWLKMSACSQNLKCKDVLVDQGEQPAQGSDINYGAGALGEMLGKIKNSHQSVPARMLLISRNFCGAESFIHLSAL